MTKIILTRSIKDNQQLKPQLEQRGYEVFSLPLMAYQAQTSLPAVMLDYYKASNWLFFTSPRSVKYFEQWLDQQAITDLESKKIACIGQRTARCWRRSPINFIPRKPTKKNFIEEWQIVHGLDSPQTIFIPQSNLASLAFSKALVPKGHQIYEEVFYRNIQPKCETTGLQEFLAGAPWVEVLIASPSAWRRWRELVRQYNLNKTYFKYLVLGTTTQEIMQKDKVRTKLFSMKY